MRKSTLAAAAASTVTAVALSLAACSNSEPETGTTGTVSPPADTSVKDQWEDAISIGVGNKQGTGLVTQSAADQVTARCIDEGDNLTIEFTAPDGWQAQLTHGSQIVKVKNDDLGYPEHDFETREGIIEATQPKNDAPNRFSMGVTWDKPGPGEVEVQLEDETPPQWVVDSPYKEFAMYAHITCAS